MQRSWRRLCIALGLLLCCTSACETVAEVLPIGAARPFDGELTVMTYNIKGGSWPVALNRSQDLYAIGARLRRLRDEGRNPEIVLLQEAFSDDARQIARHAGYRYVVAGPSAADRNLTRPTAKDAAFVANGTWWLGEGTTRLLDSGLLILSDYPMHDVRRVAFPAYACAGLDCLANKGAVLATVSIPGTRLTVDVLDTHLNSRVRSLVSDARSLYAYRRQTEIVSNFIAANRDSGTPLIAAGDFNVGKAAARKVELSASLRRWNLGLPVRDALHAIVDARRLSGLGVDENTRAVVRRNTDFIFFAPGTGAALLPEALAVPFGRERSGGMLSDHPGYLAVFRLSAMTGRSA